jgi:hypothetical protein
MTDWRLRFVSSRIRHGNRARAKLARILPQHVQPLAPLDDLRRCLGPVALPPIAIEKAWLYLANAFDNEGLGLFVESVAENLAIAQDHVLVQYLLPHVVAQNGERADMRSKARERLALTHRRVCATMQRVASPSRGGPHAGQNVPTRPALSGAGAEPASSQTGKPI